MSDKIKLETTKRGAAALFLATLGAAAYLYGIYGSVTWIKCTVATGSCALILAVWALFIDRRNAKRAGRLTFFLILGLLFSILGDRFMSIRGDDATLFLAAIGSFFLAHLSFLIGFLSKRASFRRFVAATAILTAGLAPYFALRLAPAIPNAPLLVAASAYLAISILSLSGAFALDFRPLSRAVATIGVASIVFSDILIAEEAFRGETRLAFLIIPTYLATHLLLTLAVMLESVVGRSTDSPKSGED